MRFADDFIVLCKSPAQAEAAGAAAQKSLAEHGLELHPDKTHITAMQDGFKYLGYLFVNDMALDISGAEKQKQTKPLQAPPNSWLAQLGERGPTRLKQQDVLEKLAEKLRRGEAVQLSERDKNGTLLTVTGDPTIVTMLNKHLRVFRNDKCLVDMPWNSLQTVILFGNHQITTQAMHAALRNQIPIHLSKTSGTYQGVITPNQPAQGHKLWLSHLIAFGDEEKALYCSRQIVGARLRHLKETLRQRKKGSKTVQIDNAIRQLNRAENIESLRGFEGQATREFYQAIAEVLPAEFNFAGRNLRPPRDPFNVLLSLGHTVVYSYSESILHTVGLLPWQGFYHQGRGRHAALASDLMEPFRHVVERAALTVVLRHEIKPN